MSATWDSLVQQRIDYETALRTIAVTQKAYFQSLYDDTASENPTADILAARASALQYIAAEDAKISAQDAIITTLTAKLYANAPAEEQTAITYANANLLDTTMSRILSLTDRTIAEVHARAQAGLAVLTNQSPSAQTVNGAYLIAVQFYETEE